jgi:regulator of nonsense transcripts 3
LVCQIFRSRPIHSSTFYLVAAIQHPALPKTTPLLEALKAEKLAQKDKESIIRNHAHYKDQPVGIATPTRKDDPKKKSGPIPIPKVAPTAADASNVATPGGGSGKKSHKKGQAPAANAALPPMIAQKNTAQNNTATKHTNVAPVAGAAPKSPKASRTSRPLPQVAAITGGTSTPEVPGVALPAQGAPGPPPRRPRPVVGLGSRHFEAALNGAGVSAPGDRKSRREREREKEVTGAPSSVTPSGGPVPTETKPPQSSPRRDRGGRKEAAQAQASGGAGAVGGMGLPALVLGGGPSDLPRVPGILQRDGPTAPGVAIPRIDPDSGVTVPVHDAGAPPFHGGRGGRRGRGKGRGARGG